MRGDSCIDCNRLGVYLARRVLQLMQAPVAPVVPPAPQNNGADSTIVSAPAPLPAARVSVNVRVSVHGHDVQITLRGDAEDEVLARLDAVLTRYAPPQPQTPSANGTQALTPQQHNAAAMHKRVTDFCPVHNVAMKQNHGKDGRTWYSHYDETAGRWCKGK